MSWSPSDAFCHCIDGFCRDREELRTRACQAARVQGCSCRHAGHKGCTEALGRLQIPAFRIDLAAERHHFALQSSKPAMAQTLPPAQKRLVCIRTQQGRYPASLNQRDARLYRSLPRAVAFAEALKAGVGPYPTSAPRGSSSACKQTLSLQLVYAILMNQLFAVLR